MGCDPEIGSLAGRVGLYSSAPPVNFLPPASYRDKQRCLVVEGRLNRLGIDKPFPMSLIDMLLDREMSFTSKEVQVLQSDTNRHITASIPKAGRIPRSGSN